MPREGEPTWSLHKERGYYTLLIQGPFKTRKFPIDEKPYHYLENIPDSESGCIYLARLTDPDNGSFLVSLNADKSASLIKDY